MEIMLKVGYVSVLSTLVIKELVKPWFYLQTYNITLTAGLSLTRHSIASGDRLIK